MNKDFVEKFLNGKESNAYKSLGAHLIRNDKLEIVATQFLVYAPHAYEVRLISSINNYQGYNHVFEKVDINGFFFLNIDENLEYENYKYEISTPNGVFRKSDPFGFFSEVRPSNSSVVIDLEYYHWNDSKYLKNKQKIYDKNCLIYEVHLGSWRKNGDSFKRYNEVVDELIGHMKYNGFTHVEFMPLYEYPLDDSWGYQGTGLFSINSRFGSPKDFMYMVDRFHQAGIGVILDFVIGHICKDAHGLSFFDGTPLYEFEDRFRRENTTWGTNNLDFGKGITRSFILSSLDFYLNYYHIDGYRIDAVSNLLYYLGNPNFGENMDAINFIKQAGIHLFGVDDRVLFIAEDSTAYPKVTESVELGGVGFNYKWDMGFMNDSLKYFKEDPINRVYHHDKLTFGLMYAYNEKFILPFSHDEVVYGKGSMLNKMPGDYFSKFANYRVFLTFVFTRPGKKLFFMGAEFAQFNEWDFHKELDWSLYEYPAHVKLNLFFHDLAAVYNTNKAFHLDQDPTNFKWLVVNDSRASVYAYFREYKKEVIVVILNMTSIVHKNYHLGVPYAGSYCEILNSDKDIYFGSNQYNGVNLNTIVGTRNNQEQYIDINLGPLTGIIFKLLT
jgi:1,4-alpha-glucan branching enzyme